MEVCGERNVRTGKSFCEVFKVVNPLIQPVIPLEHWDKALETAKSERAKVIKDELIEHDTRFLAVYIEAKNCCLVLLSEREDKLGTLAIAVPKPKDLLGPVSSSVLLGDKNAISARMFAESVASIKGKIALVSVYLEKLSEIQAQAYFMHLIDRVMKKEKADELSREKTGA